MLPDPVVREHFDSLEEAGRSLPRRPLHLAIGMFDGVHLGHRAVVEAAVQSAHRSGGVAIALTFHPHPSRLLRPEAPVPLIQTPQMKARRLLACGVNVVITEPFTPALARIEAEALLPYLKQHLPELAGVYVGENWRFGRGRRGDVDLLNVEARRLDLTVVSAPRINHNGRPISSTRIRHCLTGGDIAMANALLGYCYASEGMVEAGKGLGREIGFSTLNLRWVPECRPRLGVYVARAGGQADGAMLPAVANYGVRPTVEDAAEPMLEVHMLGECPFKQGDVIQVEWLHFLRPERRFATVEELRAQIAEDARRAQAFHRAGRRKDPAP